VLRIAVAFLVALSGAAFLISHASAQGEADPLIVPPEGEPGSRFQIVGQRGWTSGEAVTIEFAFTESPPNGSPLMFGGPQQVTVLRDGTWSFPVVLTDQLFGMALATPGYVVVRATSPTQVATNSFILTVGGARPVGAPPAAGFGFGPDRPLAAAAVALLCAGTGTLVLMSERLRRRTAYCRPDESATLRV
jgi:hypothetical protein